MKHLIILSLLTLPLIACKSVNTYQQPPKPPADPGQEPPKVQEDPGQKADEVQEDPVVYRLGKIVERDSIESYVTYTFTKTYKSENTAIDICEKLGHEAENLIGPTSNRSWLTREKAKAGTIIPPIGPVRDMNFSTPCTISFSSQDDPKIKADLTVIGTSNTFTLKMTLTLPKPKQTQ